MKKAQSVLEQLEKAVTIGSVLTDSKNREFYSTDLSCTSGEIADLVLQPGNAQELADSIKVVTDAGMNIVPRGGGMSYTQGYQPEKKESVLIDMRSMDRVLEINSEDMYVTVEAGCTWKKLYEALAEQDLRTPILGPCLECMPQWAGRFLKTVCFWALVLITRLQKVF